MDTEQTRTQQSIAEFDFYASSSPIVSLARAIEMKDPYTAGHTWRVARYGRLLAEALDFPPHQLNELLAAGCLHDVGKIAVPDDILTKPGRLTEDEFEIMKRHPQDGFDFLRFDQDFAGTLDVVLMHHEAYDGTGYPIGLAGESIPPAARVFAVADAFDAMTSSRPYRQGMPPDEAVNELNNKRGQQFDPEMAGAFERLYRGHRLDRVIGYTDEGVRVGHCPQCGPVIEVRRNTKPGDRVRCQVCRAAFALAGFEGPQPRLEFLHETTDPPQPHSRGTP